MRPYKFIIFSLLVLSCAMFQRAYAQPLNPLISFSVESCNLNEALEKLFAEYELNVVFSKAELSKIRIESYSCSYKSVEEVLTDLLKGTGYDFKKVGKQYVIRKTQLYVPVRPDNQETEPVTVLPEETVTVKTDTVVNSTADTIRVIDTVQVIRTVMRYDTIIRVETQHDTVFAVKYKGVAFPWPSFNDNGWFVSPALTISSLGLKCDFSGWEQPVEITPVSAYCVSVDGGYKHKRMTFGISLAYKSLKYSFSFDQSIATGDCYVNDTLDTYYVVHSAGDTVYQYIIDSTYIPMSVTDFAYRDVNRFDYLAIGLFGSVDFVKLDYFRAFVKAGLSADVLLSCSGSTLSMEMPYHTELTRQQATPLKLSYFGGMGVGLKVGNHFELVPEVRYRGMIGSLCLDDVMMDVCPHFWDFRLGLTYYF